MSDQETLEELRELLQYAKQDAEDSQEKLDAITATHYARLQQLDKATNRYMAHLEMMAAVVTK